MHRPRGDTFFAWHTGRGAACLESLIPDDWHGILQCDGYASYPAFIRKRRERTDAVIVLAGCMAHARRGFYEAIGQARTVCGFILRQMQHLYAIERRLRETKAGPAQREAMRAAQSRPVMQRLHRTCARLHQKHRYLPQSSMGQALGYLLNHWTELSRFLEDGRIEIGRVGDRRGGVRTRASEALRLTFRFLSPLVEPDVQISRIRLSSPTYSPSHSTGLCGCRAA
jgi:hypothetical protein